MPKSAEFILQPNLNTVVLVEPFGPSFAAILEKLAQDATVQTVECISAMDTLSVVRQTSACVIIAHAANGADVAQHLTILKTLAPQIQIRKTVRMLITVSSSLSTELVEKLTVYGCTEIIPDATPGKALLFKLDRHLKGLLRPGAGGGAEALNDVTRIPGLGGRPEIPGDSEPATPEPAAGVRLAPALELPEDCWCLSGGGASRKNDRWHVRLRGPAPDQGRWVATEKSELWKWTPAEEGPESGGSGESATGWFFRSDQRPEYRRGFWLFSAPEPVLEYLENGNSVAQKFRTNEKGSIVVARDSDTALSWLAIARGKVSQKTAQHEMQVALAAAPESAPAAPVSDAKVVFVDPLGIKSDFWIIEKLLPRCIAGRWLIQVVGPGPAVGRWVAQVAKGDKETDTRPEKWWRWVPDAGDRDPFIKELGAWFFYGLAPNFARETWAFASSSPELGFYFKGRSYGAKFKLIEDNVLEVARDSAAAMAALQLIKISFERQVAPRAKADPLAPPAGAPAGAAVERGDPRSDGIEDPPLSAAPESAAPADAIQEGPRVPEGLEKIFAAEAPGPSLSALALVFLASELVSRRDGDLRSRCDRYCAYLLASFGGLRAELWIRSAEGEWVCVGTPDRDEGRYRECARAGAGLRALRGVPMRIVEVRPALQDAIGILVIGGRGAQKIDVNYAETAARAAVGLVFGARAEQAALAESESAAA